MALNLEWAFVKRNDNLSDEFNDDRFPLDLKHSTPHSAQGIGSTS